MSDQTDVPVDSVSRETPEQEDVKLTPEQIALAEKQTMGDGGPQIAGERKALSLASESGPITPFMPRDTLELKQTVMLIVRGGVVPKGFMTNGAPDIAKMAVAILAGREVGFGPMMSLRSIMIVNGMPSVWGAGAKALVQKTGQVTDYIRAWVLQSTVRMIKRDDPTPDDHDVVWAGEEKKLIAKQVPLPASTVPISQWPTDLACLVLVGRQRVITPYWHTFSVGDATRAKLWNNPKKLYGSYPQDMLEHRAAARCYDRGFSDHLMGLAIRELIDEREDPQSRSANDTFLRSDAS